MKGQNKLARIYINESLIDELVNESKGNEIDRSEKKQ